MPIKCSELQTTEYIVYSYKFQDNYDKQFLRHVYSCPIITFEELRRGLVKTKDPVRIQYNTKDQFKRTAKLLGLMDDLKVRIAIQLEFP